MANPILIEATRGPLVESWHRGAIAIAAPSGALALELGDVKRPVFPRSAVKALQTLPLVETGAADRFGFGSAEIALACGSHAGTEKQAGLAAAMLVRAGLHTGEVELQDRDVTGLAVVIGARVCDLAGPGEVLVTSTVRDLVVGSGIEFEDRGRHELKGVPGEWQVLAVQE